MEPLPQRATITALSILLAIAWSPPALAQDEELGEIDLDEIDLDELAEITDEVEVEERPETEERFSTEVRSTRLEDDPDQTRISREEIESSPANSVVELLEHEAGLFASAGSRGERRVRIRGFDQRQIYTVIDGVPAYIPYDGQIDLGKIPVELIEDVVVLRGPSSLQYGPGGMAGTLSIRTRQPGHGPLLSTRVEGGRGPHLRLGAAHSAEAGRFSWLLGAGMESREAFPLSAQFAPTASEDGGEREQSDRFLRHLVGRLRFRIDPDSWIEATAWQVVGEWGIPPSTTSSSPRHWRMTEWRTTMATVTHRWMPAPTVMIQEVAFVGLFDNLLDAFDDDTYSSQTGPDAFSSWYHDLTAGGWARARISLPRRTLLRLEVGGRYERHRREDETTITSEVSRAVILGATQVESRLSPETSLTAAFQTEVETGLEATVAPSFDAMMALQWRPEGPLSLGVSAARRSRTPSLRERYSRSTGESAGRLPNPSLRSEVARHLGLDGALQPFEWLRLEVALFEAEVVDLIEERWIDEDTNQFQNVARARLAGVEVGLRLEPWAWLEAELGYRYLYARALDEEGRPGPLADRPVHMARLTLTARPLRILEISTRVRLTGPILFEDPESHLWRELGTTLAWDARVEGQPLPGIRLWVQVTNLLDANYQLRWGYPEPGWQIWAGARMELRRRERAREE